MRKTKRLLTVLLALMMMFNLAGCSNSSNNASSQNAGSDQTAQTQEDQTDSEYVNTLRYPDYEYDAFAYDHMVLFVPEQFEMQEIGNQNDSVAYSLANIDTDNYGVILLYRSLKTESSSFEDIKKQQFGDNDIHYAGHWPYIIEQGPTSNGREIFSVFALLENDDYYWELVFACMPETAEEKLPYVIEMIDKVYFE